MHLVGTFLESTGMIGKMVEEHTKCVGKNCKPQTYDHHIFPNKIETCSLAIFFLFFLISKINSYENFSQKYKIKITFRNVFHDSSLFKRLKPYLIQNPAKILTRGPYSVYPGVSNSELSIQAQSRDSINLGSSNEYMFKYLFLQFSSSEDKHYPKTSRKCKPVGEGSMEVGREWSVHDWWLRFMISDMPLLWDWREFSNENTKVKTTSFLSTGRCCWRSFQRRTQTENLFNHLLWRNQNL